MLIAKKLYQHAKSTLCYLMLLSLSLSAIAQQEVAKVTVEDLLQSGDLTVSIGIDEQQQFVPGQQVILEIKVASTSDFTGNTKVAVFDIENAIVANPFAKTGFNVETIDGKEWFSQSKETAVYPLYDGDYQVPPIVAEVFINIDGKVVSGKISTPPYQFTIPKLAELTGKSDYIASSELTIERRITQQPEQALEVGSAVTIKRALHGDALHAVMLPDIEPLQFEGAQVYEKPANKSDSFDVMDQVSQGHLTAESTIIFQEEGIFKIPAKSFKWWDTTENKLKTITVEEMIFQVGDSDTEFIANSPQKSALSNQGSQTSINWWLIVISAAVLMFLIAIGKVIVKNKDAVAARFEQKSKFKNLVTGFLSSTDKGEYQLALCYLYKIADIKNDNKKALTDLVTSHPARETLDVLFSSAFSETTAAANITTQEAKALLEVVLNNNSQINFFTPVKFNLDLN